MIHLCTVRKITIDSAKSESTKCDKAGMAREELAESQKPVNITLKLVTFLPMKISHQMKMF